MWEKSLYISLCRARGAWLHVDAAYGGALGVLPERRDVMAGVELADSVVVNPHKWLFVPLDFSALYTRRPEVLRAVFALTPEYLRGDATPGEDRGAATPGEDRGAAVDYMDYGIQLGRRFRALKAWMVIRAFGRSGIASRIREHCRLAARLAAWVAEDERFVLAAPLTMAVVCFRFAPAEVSDEACDRLNEQIVERVNATGEGYLTHTTLRGRTVMRVGIGNVLTTEADVARVWASVQAATGTR